MNTKEFLKAELDKLDRNAYWEIDGYGNTEFICKVMELYADAVNKNAVLPHVSGSLLPLDVLKKARELSVGEFINWWFAQKQ